MCYCLLSDMAQRIEYGVGRLGRYQRGAVMPRESATSISIDPNLRCLRVYPVETSTKTIADLKTVGIRLNRDQAIHLARILLAVTQDWDDLEITAYRAKPRQSDDTYQVTVTSYQR